MSSALLQENLENTCVVCFKNVFIYSIGECDHPVCYDCSTRMRVLCRQNECPICRQDMPKVIFVREIKPFRMINNNRYIMDKKFKICFESPEIQSAYNKLLEHVCARCPGCPAFRTFQNLKDHMRKEHELYYCDLCVDNLKIFTGERRCYTRQELAQHRRKGDSDDRSHRGHPLCEFCDQRYMDNDELFRHLRRDHLFCHFCDTDGYHQYYSSYDFLRDHFRAEHFLCEEGGCSEEKFTSVFRTEIDLKAHRASVHGRSMGKAAVKQARTLELEFTLAPRIRDRVDGSKRGAKGRPKPDEDDNLGAVGGSYDEGYVENKTFFKPQINTDCIEEFPTLSGTVTTGFSAPLARPNTRHVTVNNNRAVTIRTVRQSQQPLAVTDENFPVLGGDSGCKTVRLSVNSNNQDHLPLSSNVGASKAPTNVSIHVNHHPRGAALSTRLTSSQNFQLRTPARHVPSNEDFPSLSGSKKTSSNSAEWLSNSSSSSAKQKMQAPPQQTPVPKKHFTVQEEFPSLNSDFQSKCNMESSIKNENRTKKASSLMIPVSSSWTVQASSQEDLNHNKEKMHDSDTPASEMGIRNIKVKSKKKKLKNSPNSSTSSKSQNLNNNKETNVFDIEKSKKQTETVESIDNSHLNENSKFLNPNFREEKRKGDIGSSQDVKSKVGVERKRSELLIANLVSEGSSVSVEQSKPTSSANNHNTFSLAASEFPTLGSSATCPPGFLEIPTTKSKFPASPPPGFVKAPGGCLKNPPPGFSVSLNNVTQPSHSNGLTFTNSNGQQYYIFPDSQIHQFVPPHNSNGRNLLLTEKVRKCVSNLDEFMQYSALFKQGSMSAENYYNHCLQMMGSSSFKEIFPELLLLLPDIRKQQELLTAHATHSGNGKPPAFEVCATCGQVLSPNDLCHHLASHRFENHFPALDTPKSSLQPAWGRSQ